MLKLLFLLLILSNDTARKGNKAYEEGNFAQAEQLFRQALTEDPQNPRILFNLANALAKQEKFEQAVATYEQYKAMVEDPEDKSKADYNIGNVLGQMQKWDQALKYFKEALKRDPNDEEAKYNYELAYKQKKEQEEQQNQQGNDQNNQNKDKNDEQNKDENQQKNEQNQQNKDQNDQQQQNQENQENQENQDKELNKQNQQNKQSDQQQDQQKSQQPMQAQMSKEEAQKILQALDKKERDLLKQFKKPKTENTKKNNGKDW